MVLRPASRRFPWVGEGRCVPLTKYRPGGTITSSGWTAVGAASLFAAVNEVVPDTANYAQSAVNPSADVMELSILNVQAPPVGTNHTIRHMLRGSTGAESVTFSIIGGNGATIVKSVVYTAPLVATIYAVVLTAAEAAVWAAAGYPGSRLRWSVS